LRSTRGPALTVGPSVPPPSEATFPFRRILYATDFTPAAAHAAAYAIWLAKEFRATIDVLNVIPRGAVKHPDRLSDLTKDFYGALDAVVPKQAREFCNPRSFVEVGKAQEQIENHIRRRSIDLLVLGIRKRSHLGIATRNSRVFRIIVDAACPVLTVTG
jgi:nucleotide-binding universal stress UspA family protein